MKKVLLAAMQKIVRAVLKRTNPVRFYVFSEEPFSENPVWRGPFSRADAETVMGVNSACGSRSFMYVDCDGILVSI